MGKKSVKKNYLYNVSYQILLLITPLITTPYISRVLGADGIGKFSYAESIVSYFTLFAAMGITTFGQREISYVQDDISKRSHIFWETKILSFMVSFICLLLYVCFALKQQSWQIYLVLSFNILAVSADITWFFQGLEEFKKIVIRNAIFKIVNILYIFLFVRKKSDVIIYTFGVAFFFFISNVCLWGSLPGFLTKIDWKRIKPFHNIRIIISLFVPTIAIQIYTVLDKTMIGIITDNSYENGYYEQAIKTSRMLLTLVTALGTVMIPRIGYHFERKEHDLVKDWMYRGYRFVWFLGIPLCLGLIGVSSNFVPWFYGVGFGKVSLLLSVLAFLILSIGISNVTGMQYLIPTKRQNVFTITVLIGAATNFFMNLLLIPKLQSVGAAVASVTAETVIAISQLYIVRKELSVNRIFKSGIKYLIAGLVMFILIIEESKHLTASILNTILLIISGMVVYFFLLIILRDDFLLINIKKVLNISKNKRFTK